MKVREIISSNNTIFKVLLTLTRARGIKKYEMALLSGPKQIGEVLRDFPDHCSGIIFSDHHETPVVPASLEIPFYRLRSELFRQIDLYDTHQPVLLVRVDPFSRVKGGHSERGSPSFPAKSAPCGWERHF